MKKIHLQTLMVVFLLIGCAKEPTIEGLWIIKVVSDGTNEMTPDARWVRFNADFSQQSGNGWFQHSVGTWKLDPSNAKSSITNTNGLKDLSDPFDVTLSGHAMVWKRTEEGQAIEVKLERANKLPTTTGDQLLGLWKLEKAVGNGSYFSQAETTKDYLFLKWDKRFVIGSEHGKVSGVYQVNGHKPEVALIPSNEQSERSLWNIQFDENALTLSLLDTDSIITRTFKRIHEFPK